MTRACVNDRGQVALTETCVGLNLEMSRRVVSFRDFHASQPTCQEQKESLSGESNVTWRALNFSPSLTILRNWPRGLVVSRPKIYRAFRVCNRLGVFLGVNPERITLLQSAISVCKRVRRVGSIPHYPDRKSVV